jgi:hypothetical protein
VYHTVNLDRDSLPPTNCDDDEQNTTTIFWLQATGYEREGLCEELVKKILFYWGTIAIFFGRRHTTFFGSSAWESDDQILLYVLKARTLLGILGSSAAGYLVGGRGWKCGGCDKLDEAAAAAGENLISSSLLLPLLPLFPQFLNLLAHIPTPSHPSVSTPPFTLSPFTQTYNKFCGWFFCFVWQKWMHKAGAHSLFFGRVLCDNWQLGCFLAYFLTIWQLRIFAWCGKCHHSIVSRGSQRKKKLSCCYSLL